MPELVKLEIIEQPEIVILGKLIRVNRDELHAGKNPIPAFWGKCFEDGVFATLEALADHIHNPAYVGYMNSDYEYICGMMMKSGVPVPDGFAAHTLEPTKVAVGWIKGKKDNEPAIYANAHTFTEKAMLEKGMKFNSYIKQGWCMEVYTCPRFTTPDENGDIILDFYLPCE